MRVHNELSLKPVRLYRERNDERKINRWLKVRLVAIFDGLRRYGNAHAI